jgi:hypothetical protein
MRKRRKMVHGGGRGRVMFVLTLSGLASGVRRSESGEARVADCPVHLEIFWRGEARFGPDLIIPQLQFED